MHRGGWLSSARQWRPVCFFFFNLCIFLFRTLQFAIKSRWQRSKNDPDRKHWLDWAEEKYSVTTARLAGTTSSPFSRVWAQRSVPLPTEATDPGGEDGAAGFDPLHPTAHVLGPLRPAGTKSSRRSLWVGGARWNFCLLRGPVEWLTVNMSALIAGLPLDPPGCQDEHGFCESYRPIARTLLSPERF